MKTTHKNDAADRRIGDFIRLRFATANSAAETVLNGFEQCGLLKHSTQRDVDRNGLPTGKGADDCNVGSPALAEAVVAIKRPVRRLAKRKSSAAAACKTDGKSEQPKGKRVATGRKQPVPTGAKNARNNVDEAKNGYAE